MHKVEIWNSSSSVIQHFTITLYYNSHKYRYWKDWQSIEDWNKDDGVWLCVYRRIVSSEPETLLSSNTLNDTSWKEHKTDLYLHGTEMVTSGKNRNANAIYHNNEHDT